jgi:TonB family protein
MRLPILILALTLCASAQAHKVGVLKFEHPAYWPITRIAHVTGEVRMLLRIAANGNVESIEIESGHPMLRDQAKQTIATWKFVCLDCGFGESFTQRVTLAYKMEGEAECGLTRLAVRISIS